MIKGNFLIFILSISCVCSVRIQKGNIVGNNKYVVQQTFDTEKYSLPLVDVPNNIEVVNEDDIMDDIIKERELNNNERNNDYVYRRSYNDNNNCDNDTIKGYIAMPFYYRTPELVAYAKGEDNPSFESDLFQLGLVIAYIFTRQNVLMAAKIIDEPIRVKPFSIHRGKYSGKIKYALNGMLNIDKEKRWDLDNTYKYFSKLFMDYAKDDLELNGKQ